MCPSRDEPESAGHVPVLDELQRTTCKTSTDTELVVEERVVRKYMHHTGTLEWRCDRT
jgi:hypothetical protein